MKRTLILHDLEHQVLESSADREFVRLWDSLPNLFMSTVWHEVRIVVNDVSKLQGAVAFVREIGRTARLSIEIKEAVAIGLLHGPLGPVDGRQVLSMTREQSNDATSLRVRLGFHAPVWALLASVLATPLSLPTGLGPRTRLGIGSGVDPSWLGLAPGARFYHDDGSREIDLENPGPLPRMDLVIVSEDRAHDVAAQPPPDIVVAHSVTAVSTSRPGWAATARVLPGMTPPVETRIFNPVGVVRDPKSGWAYLRAGASGRSLVVDSKGVAIAEFDSVTPGTIADLRGHWGVIDSGAAFDGPVSRVEALARLTASGVPVVSPDAPTTLRGWMPQGVLDGFGSDKTVAADAESREGLIIRQVRNAHRFATWRSPAYSAQRGDLYQDPSVSVGIATMRPEYLEHVLDTFESQTWPRKQLLIGLHGFELSQVAPDIQRRVAELADVVEWPRDGLFGDLLRELTLRADGDLFAKMDDDDWYAPFHLEDLVYSLQYSDATLVGCAVQFVYMHSADITIRRSIDQSYRYGGHPGGPTFMATRDMMLRAGGWPRVRRAVDTGFNEAVLALGGTVYQSHAHNFLFNRRSAGHTWKATNAYFIEKAKFSWHGIRPPLGFEGSEFPNLSWRSSASSVAPLVVPDGLTRVSARALSRLSTQSSISDG